MGALRAGFHGTVGQSSAQVIEGSLRFENDKSQYLKRTAGSGNQKKYTFSTWIKRGVGPARIFGDYTGGSYIGIDFSIRGSDDAIEFHNYSGSSYVDQKISNDKFRDMSGWYHAMFIVDTTESASEDKIKIYVNGRRITSWATNTVGTATNGNTYGNTATEQRLGYNYEYSDQTLTQTYFIDGQALGREYFGFTDPLTNTWRPKKFKGPTSPNDGTTWSSNLTVSGGTYTIQNPENAFDNDSYGTYADASGIGDAVYTFSPTSTIKANSSVRVSAYAANGTTLNHVKVTYNNGVEVTKTAADLGLGTPGDQVWFDLSSYINFPADISSIEYKSIGGGGRLAAIEIDGILLIDGFNDPKGFGTNGFYLPMDGNSPIGLDKSGRGNNWRPVSFGGSIELPKATGALPILKTNEAGTVAKLGVRTDRKSYTVTASGGRYYLDGTEAPILNAYRGGSYTFDYTGATSHPFYLSSLQDGKHNSEAYSVEFDGTTSSKYLTIDDTADLRLGTGDWTIEEFVYIPTGTTLQPYWVNSLCIGGESNSEVGASIYHTGLSGGSDNSVAGGVSYIGPSNSYRLFHRIDTRGRWVHIAVTRESGTVRLFVDGHLSDSITDTTDYNGTSGSKIGVGNISQSNYLNGKVSNVRVVKGQALYTSNFTPPSTTLTTTSQGAIASNVKLLCCQDNDPTNATVIPTGSTISNNNGTAAVNSSPFLYDINGYYGINTATTNTTKITIPHWAPDTLYYYCNVHSGMGSSINITTDIFKADPYAWKNVLSLPLVGSKEDVSNQFNIESTTKVTTANGGVTSSKGQSNFYGSSYSFDATDDYISIPTDSDFRFGYHDWTIECWHYSTKAEGGTSTNSLMGIWNTSNKRSWLLNLYGSRFRAYFSTNGAASPNIYEVSGSSSPVKANRWYHVAAVKEGNNFHLFQDGVLVDTRSDVVDLPSFENTTDELRIGARTGNTNYTNGYIQDVRIYKGVAKYTGTTSGVQYFVPASTNPDVLPDTPSGVSGGSKLTKITEGSVNIAGTTDYLLVSDSTDLELGGDDFTIEAYINPTGIPGSQGYNCIFAKGESLQCYFMSNGTISLYASTDYASNNYDIIQNANVTGFGSVSLNRWYHLAVCRSGDTWKVFVDGIEKYSGTHSGSIEDNAYGFSIGDYAPSAGTYDYQGFISNLRLVKGTALYTSDFTPPTSPLTNVTNTKLLCCQSNTSAGAAVVSPNISGAINTGVVWSDNFTSTSNFNSSYPPSNAFDGSDTTYAEPVDTGSTMTVTFDPPLVVSGDFEVKIGSSGELFTTINGGSSTSQGSGLTQYHTLGNNITVSNFTYTSSTRPVLYSVRVNGSTLLTDPISKKGDASATNFNPFTDDINTIRGQETGYATLNPLALGDNITLSEGNLKASEASTSGHTWSKSNIGVTSGKWYVEITVDSATGPNAVGLTNFPHPHTGWIGADSSAVNQFNIIYNNGTTRQIFDANVATTNYISGAQWSVGDVLQIAYDADAGKAWFGINNTWYQANATSISSDDVASGKNATFVSFLYDSEYFFTTNHHDAAFTYNFGQKPFKFPPPDGFQPLNAANIRPEKVIVHPDRYVGIVTYTGNGGEKSINELKFNAKPDLVWIKNRDSTENHMLYDTVRGAYQYLYPNTLHESNDGTSLDRGLTKFDFNGFTVKDDLNGGWGVNKNGDDFVSWCWKAGGNKNIFNIDDVGYANASDVNMSVGDLNGTAFNTGAIWSDMMSGTSNSGVYTNLFDGTDGPSGGYEQPTNGNTLTFTPTGGITASTSIEIYVFQSADTYSSSADITVNGTSIKTTAVNSTLGTGSASGYVNIGTKSLTTLTWSNPGGSNNDYRLMAIRVDGKILLDSDQTAPNVPTIAATGCSVGTKQGFSIIKYTGTGTAGTIPHGLLEQPKFVVIKDLKNSNSWAIQHVGTTLGSGLLKWGTSGNAAADNSPATAVWNSTSPSSFVFSVGTSGDTNYTTNSAEYIAYLWHDVPGLQKFGTFVGNADPNGPYVELGFKPAVVWIKNSSDGGSSDNWACFDNVREGYNVDNDPLYLNKVNTEATTDMIDLLSNGFKIRGTYNSINGDGNKMVYCAWAAAPSFNLYGGQFSAR
tara:strand:+ start:3390 stop:9674 length:6285 start_codon:yes stop_codon:yes gene_type:complete